MGAHADHWIRKMVETHQMIEPFEPTLVKVGNISFGCSSYGYDMRLANEFMVPKINELPLIDPKKMASDQFETVHAKTYTIPPHGFVIGRSLEYFRIPRDIIAISFGKSTYSRAGITVLITPFEPEWEGFVTFPIVNLTPIPAKIYPLEGIAQVLFVAAEEPCETSYHDRQGKYQKQDKLTLSKI